MCQPPWLTSLDGRSRELGRVDFAFAGAALDRMGILFPDKLTTTMISPTSNPAQLARPFVCFLLVFLRLIHRRRYRSCSVFPRRNFASTCIFFSWKEGTFPPNHISLAHFSTKKRPKPDYESSNFTTRFLLHPPLCYPAGLSYAFL